MKLIQAPPPPVASATVRSKAVVLLLFIHCLIVVAPIVCRDLVLCLCFVLQYVVLFLVLQPSCRGKERELVALLLLCYECHVTLITTLLSFFDSSSQCHGLFCSM